MKTTTTIHWNSGQISREHNLREKDLCSHEEHIDLENKHGKSFHETVLHKPLREAYEEIFGEAIYEYNAKQKRSDRRLDIDKYMKIVDEDTRGRKQTEKVNGKRVRKKKQDREGKQLSYEFTICVGNTHRQKDPETGWAMCDEYGQFIFDEALPRDLQCIILQRYYETFEENNPNFRLVSVCRHGDEGFYHKYEKDIWEYGTIHDHYEIIPVATGFKQGLSIQNSMGKALSSMGFDGIEAYGLWSEKEKNRLADITKEEYVKYCKQHPDFAMKHGDLTIYTPVSDKNKQGGLTKEQYQAKMELEQDREELERIQEKLKTKNEELTLKEKLLREQWDKQFEDYKARLSSSEGQIDSFLQAFEKKYPEVSEKRSEVSHDDRLQAIVNQVVRKRPKRDIPTVSQPNQRQLPDEFSM